MLSVSPSSLSGKSLESTDGPSALEVRLENIKSRIAKAESRAGRPTGSTILLAASKTQKAEQVLAAHRLGVLHFGENYVQEATKKMEKVSLSQPGAHLHWHLIGGLQTNKSKFVVGRFETVQSVDRIELASALSSRAEEAGVIQNILVQIKLGDEPTKGGVPSGQAAELLEKIQSLKNIRIEGLMSLPPVEAEPEGSRKYFAELFKLHSELSKPVSLEQGSFQHLSMGTTHDFEVAIEEGATMVRVGTALFGAREVSGAFS